MRQRIKIISGTTNTLQITLTDANGTPYAVSTGEVVLFGIKRKVTDDVPLLVKAANVSDVGVYTVKLHPDDTENLEPGDYVYDVGLQSGQEFYNIIPPSPFIISENVTSWGCQE